MVLYDRSRIFSPFSFTRDSRMHSISVPLIPQSNSLGSINSVLLSRTGPARKSEVNYITGSFPMCQRWRYNPVCTIVLSCTRADPQPKCHTPFLFHTQKTMMLEIVDSVLVLCMLDMKECASYMRFLYLSTSLGLVYLVLATNTTFRVWSKMKS